MGGRFRIGALLVAILLAGTALALLIVTRIIAKDMLLDPVEDRDPLVRSPVDFGTIYENVSVRTPTGLELAGWYIPPQNGALVILQHGYEENRQNMLDEAEMLSRHGYGVLLSTVRGHDQNGEDLITFGCREMEDLQSWYDFLLGRDEVDPARIGILGQSLGGSLAIQYAVENDNIKAVVAHSPLTSLEDTVDIGLREYSPIPDFLVPPLAPLIVYWGEQLVNCDLESINAKSWIGDISPRPVFLICGGKDRLVLEENCRGLFAEAAEPAELWYEALCAHHDCDTVYPDAFEERVISFFDTYLLDN